MFKNKNSMNWVTRQHWGQDRIRAEEGGEPGGLNPANFGGSWEKRRGRCLY